MQLKDWARINGLSQAEALIKFKADAIPNAYKDEHGMLRVLETTPQATAIYARASDTASLDQQIEIVTRHCKRKGYDIKQVIKDTESGYNDTRPKLLDLLRDPDINHIAVLSMDKLSPVGANFIIQWMEDRGTIVEAVFDKLTDDSVSDFIKHLTK